LARTLTPLLLFLLTWLAPGQTKSGAPDPALIQKVTAEIAGITGLAVKRPVPFEMISRAAWKQWVNDEITRTVKPEELRVEALVLKRFGLIPADYDLRQATVDLLGEQAAAVYDHRRKRMLFVEGAAEGAMEEAVLIHELSHAVADQHFDMKRFLDKGPKSDEAQTARMAVVEGQAMWIMLESQLRKMGTTLKGNSATLDLMLPNMGKLAAETYPIFTKAPLYLRETLLFPYTAGLVFQQAVLEKNGNSGFADVLRNPPTSTQQIIHPDKYFSATASTRPAIPPIPNLKEFNKLSDGSIGELDFQILIRQYVAEPEAREIAPKLRGGSFDLLEHRKEQYALLRWSAEWDSPASAQAFFALYQKILRGKSKQLELRQISPTQLSGFNEHGGFLVTLDSARVTALEGLKRTEPAARPAL
jgi:hypothetical protein